MATPSPPVSSPTPAVAAASTSGSGPAAPPAQRRDHRRRNVGIGAGAVAAIAVAVLLVSGLLPLSSGASEANDAVSYSEATALGGQVLPGGFVPSGILTAVGIDARSSTIFGAAGFVNNTSKNCTVQELSGYPTSGSISVQSYAGSFDSGLAPFWLVVFENSTDHAAVIVTVVGAAASAVVELSGPTCTGNGTAVKPLPADVVDSPSAASAAWGQAQGYANGNPNVTALTMAAYGGATSGLFASPYWVFVYAPCVPLGGGTVKSPALTVLLGLTNVSSPLSATTSVNCPA